MRHHLLNANLLLKQSESNKEKKSDTTKKLNTKEGVISPLDLNSVNSNSGTNENENENAPAVGFMKTTFCKLGLNSCYFLCAHRSTTFAAS